MGDRIIERVFVGIRFVDAETLRRWVAALTGHFVAREERKGARLALAEGILELKSVREVRDKRVSYRINGSHVRHGTRARSTLLFLLISARYEEIDATRAH